MVRARRFRTEHSELQSPSLLATSVGRSWRKIVLLLGQIGHDGVGCGPRHGSNLLLGRGPSSSTTPVATISPRSCSRFGGWQPTPILGAGDRCAFGIAISLNSVILIRITVSWRGWRKPAYTKTHNVANLPITNDPSAARLHPPERVGHTALPQRLGPQVSRTRG